MSTTGTLSVFLTREQFDQSLTISRKEADIQSTKLDEKTREIELLHSEVSGLRERLDKSQDEVIQLGHLG
jgi:hypothetical protein